MSFLPTFIMPAPNDASLNYLAAILGHDVINGVIGANSPTALDSHVFARMMDVFNHLLLGGGLLIFSILLFVGTMNTAADGQFLGRNWHSVWTPIRLIFGILLVVPLKTGYCIGQYIILYAIFIGIHFATTVWQHAINDVFNNQDTPPPPTYLTTSIQQVLGHALNNLAVPFILQGAGIAGGGNGIVRVDVNDQYKVASGNVPPELKDAVTDDLTKANGICNYLFSGYNKECASVAFNALTSNPQSSGFFDASHLYVTVNIGTNLPSVDWNTNFINGAPSNLWKLSGNGDANGLIDVYGAYIYDPTKLFAQISNNGTTQECEADSDGTPSPAPKGPKNVVPHDNKPACVPKEKNRGATDAYNSLTAIFNNAVIQPAQGIAMSPSGRIDDEDAQKLNNICANKVSVPDPNNGNKIVQISPCDLKFAVESIMVQAQETARQNALDAAEEVSYYNPANPTEEGSTTPAQASSTPIPFPKDADPNSTNPDDIYAVPPEGQADALHKNMYKWKDKNNQWHIGYNLDDYWIADINAEKYIDLQLNNSWWMAGSSYLVLDNILGQNLAWMAQAIQTQLAIFQQAMGDNPFIDPALKYNCVDSNGNRKFEPDTQHLTSFVTPEFCLIYGAQAVEYRDSLKLNQDKFDNTSVPYSGSCQIYKQVTFWGKTINFYSCAGDLLRFSQPMQRATQYRRPNVAVSNWPKLIEPYNPSDPNPPPPMQHVDTSATPGFYQLLLGMPSSLQGPIAVMLSIAQSQPDGNKKLYPYLVGLVNLLKYNGLLSGGQVETSLPVNHSINNIFDQLIGGHATVGSVGQAEAAATSVNTVMQQVYNLGLSDNSKGVIAAQFSLIQQAQTAGISMIMACVTSMESVYNAYTAALQGMVNTVNGLTGNPKSSISGMSVEAETFAGMIPIFGPIFSTLGDNDIKQMQLAVMTTTVTTMTNITIQLMWLPLLVFIMTSLFTAGVQFAILVPLMPYILFWAGQIAWLIGVIEAVVAAPLVMLGLAHPGGHEFMGHTVPAVKMLIGVMFRPVLMVIGLIVGILLTYIVINFSAQGFHTIAADILNAVPQSEATVQGIMACLLLFIYATFLVMAFQKCFSTIYMIPEQVVQWIGGQAAKAGAEELQQISSASSQQAQGAASAGGQTLEKGIGAQKEKAQGMSDLSKQQAMTKYEQEKNWAQTAQKMEDTAMAAVKMMV